MTEWYLTTPQPNITSGYEDDAITEYAQSNFADVLDTLFSDSVILYNASLTKSREIQCVIQGNTADTQLKSMERNILAPIGTLHAGNYIYFEDGFWIVDGRPGNNKSYEKATLKVCQYKLKWQSEDGTVIERWANLTSASKYDVGEGGNNTIILSSNNYTLLIPHDEAGQTIEGKRVFIDTSNNPKKVFKITRNDDPLFLYGNHGGVLSLIADKTEFDPNKDNPELSICDYIDPSSPLTPTPTAPDEMTDLSAVISGNTNLRNGYSRTYTVTFTNKNGTAIDCKEVDYHWNLISDFDVKQTINNNQITLSVDDENLIGDSFLLQIIIDSIVISETNLNIVE